MVKKSTTPLVQKNEINGSICETITGQQKQKTMLDSNQIN